MARTAKRVIWAYGIGLLAFIIFINTPISITCISRWLFDIPCPGCGLSRSFVLVSQFDFINAFKMNILTLPILIIGTIYFLCALIDVFANKRAIERFNAILAKKWVIAVAVLLMGLSWYYNTVRW